MWSALICLLFPFYSSQNKPVELVDGLNRTETMEIVALCNTFSFRKYYKNVAAFVPFGYRWLAQTEETPLHNIVQVYWKKHTLVFVIRGTVDETNSWLENVHFMQVSARDTIQVEKKSIAYNFSDAPGASVHSGYVLALAFLSERVQEILVKYLPDCERVIFAGHSQGGALAQLFMAQFELDERFLNLDFKSYSFGSPSVGNQVFADDFNRRFSSRGQAIRFVNPKDIVCALPLVNQQFDLEFLNNRLTFDFEQVGQMLHWSMNLLSSTYRNRIDGSIAALLKIAESIVKERIGNVNFPEFTPDIFYAETGVKYELKPLPFPAYLNVNLKQGALGKLQQIYAPIQRELTFYQHSIFSYYNAIYAQFKPEYFRRVLLSELPQKMI